ncbi:MAG TPA: efflux RND transporter periplasmic adaptor subunit [Gammaproteobacteria bacterium]
MQRFAVTGALIAVAFSLLGGCEDTAPAPTTQLPQVTVAHPLVRETIDWDGYVGQFEAIERVDVRPRVSGYLVDVHFEDGQLVEQGQLLFTIDPRPFEAALDEARSREAAARAELENARTELERARSLLEIQAVSQEEFEALEAAVRTGEAALEAARAAVRARQLDLDFTRVTAPIAGRVSDRRVDPGNAVVADDTVLTTIVSVDPIHFVFEGSEALYLKYKRSNGGAGPGRMVRIRLQDEREHAWTGRLDFLDNTIDPDTGTIRGRAVVPNPDGFLTPGMFGHMLLQGSEVYSGLLLPDAAIATRGADRIVYVVDDAGLVSARTVELGPLNGGLRVIRSGVTAADRVIIEGVQRVRPGQAVQATLAAIEAPEDAAATAVADNSVR